MKVALVSFNAEWENPEANQERLRQLWGKQIAVSSPDWVVLPEMWNTGFTMKSAEAAEPLDGPSMDTVQELARQSQSNVIAGMALQKPGSPKPVNAAVVVNSLGVVAGVYEKMHPFTYSGEDQAYRAGERPLPLNVDGVRLATFVCYDLRFPELFRKVAPQVEMIVVIANWPHKRIEHWFALLRARAIENQCYVIGVNRTGVDGNNLSYPVSSQVIDPMGTVVEVERISAEVSLAEVELERVRETRERLPFLRDMKWV
ncbi:MAG: nitrilase-related carbon-nitrogen hydrolase [Candidatus Sumerlaeia bacterium]|nr:nitrilase-related carbon-nitrogen hydrolase [Candidatus Sumerlaeia bacterium]